LRTLGGRVLPPCRRGCSPSPPPAGSCSEPSIGSTNAHTPTAVFASSTSYTSRGICSRLPMDVHLKVAFIAFLVHEKNTSFVCAVTALPEGPSTTRLKEIVPGCDGRMSHANFVCAWRPFSYFLRPTLHPLFPMSRESKLCCLFSVRFLSVSVK